MERQIYQPTKNQIEKWNKFVECKPELPSDEEIKGRWSKSHHGKTTGWGLLKRQLVVEQLKYDADYQLGLWQGKLDRCNGIDYSEERNEKTYNLGYYRGYNENIHGYLIDAIKTNPNFKHLEVK